MILRQFPKTIRERRKVAASLVLAILALLAGCESKAPQGHRGWKTARIEIAGHSLNVEIADSNQTRTVGLMYRDSLPAESGMLFVYEAPQQAGFWMKNTRIPLSIAFVDEAGVVLEIRDMKPMDITVIQSSSERVRYAIEANQGWFAKHGIGAGAKVKGIEKAVAGGVELDR